MQEEFTFTELADRLGQADGQQIADQVCEELASLKRRIDARIAEGVPANEYTRLSTVSKAVAAARNVMIRKSALFREDENGKG